MSVIETERLVGRRPERDHYEALAAIVQDPLVAQTLWPGDLGGPRTDAQTKDRLRDFMTHWDKHGFGPWMFFERAGGAVAGYAGHRRTQVEDNPEVELLYAVTSARWGRGLATEMARACVQARPVDDLVCFTMETNGASRRVMEKAEFRYERDFMRASLPHVLYRLRGARR